MLGLGMHPGLLGTQMLPPGLGFSPPATQGGAPPHLGASMSSANSLWQEALALAQQSALLTAAAGPGAAEVQGRAVDIQMKLEALESELRCVCMCVCVCVCVCSTSAHIAHTQMCPHM